MPPRCDRLLVGVARFGSSHGRASPCRVVHPSLARMAIRMGARPTLAPHRPPTLIPPSVNSAGCSWGSQKPEPKL
eukprot:15463867-Alexandrium_andersonii.AAC.1